MSGENVTKILTAGNRVAVIEEIVEKIQFPTDLLGFITEHKNQIEYDGGFRIGFFIHEKTDENLTAVELKANVHPDTKKPQFVIRIGYNGGEYLYEDDFVTALEVFFNSIDAYADELDKEV